MQRFALIILLVVAMMAPATAHAHPRSHHRGHAMGPEGVGCYWERGRYFCSRYCYIEVDGYRYCREHKSHAHSQAPYDERMYYDAPRMRGLK